MKLAKEGKEEERRKKIFFFFQVRPKYKHSQITNRQHKKQQNADVIKNKVGLYV